MIPIARYSCSIAVPHASAVDMPSLQHAPPTFLTEGLRKLPIPGHCSLKPLIFHYFTEVAFGSI